MVCTSSHVSTPPDQEARRMDGGNPREMKSMTSYWRELSVFLYLYCWISTSFYFHRMPFKRFFSQPTVTIDLSPILGIINSQTFEELQLPTWQLTRKHVSDDIPNGISKFDYLALSLELVFELSVWKFTRRGQRYAGRSVKLPLNTTQIVRQQVNPFEPVSGSFYLELVPKCLVNKISISV